MGRVKNDTTIIAGDTSMKKAPSQIANASVLRLPSPLVYKGNNGKGFDIYESGIDGMPVLMPDSANKNSLQLKQTPNSRPGITGPRIFRFPKN